MNPRHRAIYLVVVVLCSMGLLSTPVECALAAGPHSVFDSPQPDSTHHHDGSHAHHAMGPETDAEASSSATVAALLGRLTTYARSDSVCGTSGRSKVVPVTPLTVLSAPAEGSAPISVTNREARLSRAIAPDLDPAIGRFCGGLDVTLPVTDAHVSPETPPPRERAV